MNKKYTVKISTPNFILSFRGRPIRSPVEIDIYEHELKLIKVQCKRAGIIPIIKDYTPPVIKDFTDDIINPNIPIVEELYENKNETILQKLLKKESTTFEGYLNEKDRDSK